MKAPIWYALLPMIVISASCSNHPPTTNELERRWEAADGGVVVLSADGSLSADSLPTAVFNRMKNHPARFSGSGTWSIVQHADGRWYVDMKFTTLSSWPGSLMNDLIIDRRNETLVLYTWVADEGGARYELHPPTHARL